jgi:hypothetical protein
MLNAVHGDIQIGIAEIHFVFVIAPMTCAVCRNNLYGEVFGTSEQRFSRKAKRHKIPDGFSFQDKWIKNGGAQELPPFPMKLDFTRFCTNGKLFRRA